LNPAELRAILGELEGLYRVDPYLWFISEVYTVDEASQQKLPYPDKAYLEDVVHVLKTEKMICFPKSRRMTMSWTMAGWATYQARFFDNHAIFIQSETENKAAFLTDKRCVFIEQNLREPLLRKKFKTIRTNEGLVGRITYHDTGSYIWAIPQGGDVIRTYTFSILVMDESEFQPEGGEALKAALSIVEEGKANQVIMLSSSNGPMGVMAEICRQAGFIKFS